ncbi:MAG TPA: ABC transporter permease [Acidimicrobiia bacterium]|nr:ABC transporter permease [Acidimicrobiia bacterium]
MRGKYLLIRLTQMVLVVLAVMTIVFVVLRVATGDPARLANPPGTPEDIIAQTRERIGTDVSLGMQYVNYVWDAVRGNLGTSFRGSQSVSSAVFSALPNTLSLAGITIVISATIAVVFGALAARRPGRLLDRAVLVYAAIAQATPAFWLAVVLVLVFSVRLRWFPAIDMTGWRSFVLPVTTLVLSLSPILVRTSRQSFIETLSEDYIKAARSRGLPSWRVFAVHGVKAASLPLITIIGLQLGYLLAGAVVVEAIFNWPGIGKLILDSLASRDFPMIQGGVLVAAVVFVVINFFVDMLYAVLDPRVRVARA